MKFSIARLMILVAMSALDVWLIRVIVDSRHEGWLDPLQGEMILLGVMPVANLLLLGALCRGPGRRNLDEFLVAGLAVLAVSTALTAFHGRAIDLLLVEVVDQVLPSPNRDPFAILCRGSLALGMILGVQLLCVVAIWRLLGFAASGRSRGKSLDRPGPRA